MDLDGFHGFDPKVLTFLDDLSNNNTREWFADNKPDYERLIKKPATSFAGALAVEMTRITGHPHRSKVFRVHRDVRFSKDKTPYNTHVHIALTPDTARTNPPMWFFGLGLEKLSLGCGVFAFDKERLEGFRDYLSGPEGSTVATLLGSLSQNGARVGEPALKTVPRGYAKDHPQAEMLKHKGLSVWIDYTPRTMISDPGIVEETVRKFKTLRPVYDLLLEL
jgi:uncharacterized protein (TIGR02453 family)